MANEMNIKRPESIKEALQVLDEALMGNTAHFREMVGDEYKNLRSAIGEISSDARGSIKNAKSVLGDFSSDKFGQLSEYSSEAFSTAVERGREVAADLDDRVKQNPWPVIGGVAVGTFALGFFMARGGRKVTIEEKH